MQASLTPTYLPGWMEGERVGGEHCGVCTCNSFIMKEMPGLDGVLSDWHEKPAWSSWTFVYCQLSAWSCSAGICSWTYLSPTLWRRWIVLRCSWGGSSSWTTGSGHLPTHICQPVSPLLFLGFPSWSDFLPSLLAVCFLLICPSGSGRHADMEGQNVHPHTSYTCGLSKQSGRVRQYTSGPEYLLHSRGPLFLVVTFYSSCQSSLWFYNPRLNW